MESGIGGKTILLKSDVLGRVRMPKQKRESLLDEFERSGMSGAAFAKWAGINYPTFASQRGQPLNIEKCQRQRGQLSILNAFPPTIRSPSSLIFAPKTQRFVGEVSIV
jgi:hypothetical protein